LFYVALTRAKEELFLTGARDYGGVREKKPSIFISESGLELDLKDEGLEVGNNEFLKDLESSVSNKKKGEEKIKEDTDYSLSSKFSFSQLAAFSTCPLQYKFAFVLKIPAPSDKPALIFGRSLHNTLYNFLLPLINDKNKQASLFPKNIKIKKESFITRERLLDIYKQHWNSDGYSSKKEREDYYIKGKKALLLFLNSYQDAPLNKIVFLEKKFSFKVGSDVIKGVIDRADCLPDGSLEVVDYKTGATKDKLDFNQKRQLILYQLFLEEYLQERVAKLTYYYLEGGEKVSFVATQKEKEKLRDQIVGEIKLIKEKDFSPKPSPLCHFCDFNSICEFRKK
jgi:CRISPR/Cas system-associated exonuclease Cas4 (RecB family)